MEIEHEQPGVEVEPGRGRPVEHPSQRAFAQILDRERGPAGVGRKAFRRRAQRGRPSRWSGRTASPRSPAASAPPRRAARTVRSASRSAAASIWVSGPPSAVTVTARSSSSCACSSGREASGLSRTPPPGTSEIGLTPTSLAQRTVLALDVEHERAPAEQQHPPQQRLDQRALALPELAEHDHVRVVEQAVAVQDPRVVTERAAARVASDEHAPAAEPAGRHERVDRLRVARRAAVPRALARSITQPPAQRQRERERLGLLRRTSGAARAGPARRARAPQRRRAAGRRRSRPETVTKPARRTSL